MNEELIRKIEIMDFLDKYWTAEQTAVEADKSANELDVVNDTPVLDYNQTIVLRALVSNYNGIDDRPFSSIWYLLDSLSRKGARKELQNGFMELNREQQAEVLKVYADGVLEWERSHKDEV